MNRALAFILTALTLSLATPALATTLTASAPQPSAHEGWGFNPLLKYQFGTGDLNLDHSAFGATQTVYGYWGVSVGGEYFAQDRWSLSALGKLAKINPVEWSDDTQRLGFSLVNSYRLTSRSHLSANVDYARTRLQTGLTTPAIELIENTTNIEVLHSYKLWARNQRYLALEYGGGLIAGTFTKNTSAKFGHGQSLRIVYAGHAASTGWGQVSLGAQQHTISANSFAQKETQLSLQLNNSYW